MNKFIRNFFLFTAPLGCITIVSIFFINKIIDQGNFYKLSNSVSMVMLGHSHTACAFNDSLMPHAKNLGQSGEAYFYTFYKLQKLLENNPNIRTVLVEFTNNQAERTMDKWIWGKESMEYRLPKYGSYLDIKDWDLLISNNIRSAIRVQSVGFKNNFLFLASGRHDYINRMDWGGYLYSDKNKVDSLLQHPVTFSHRLTLIKDLSFTNLEYLKKIINFCREKNVILYLMRSPLHPKYSSVVSEEIYKKLLLTEFPGVQLLDFKNFLPGEHCFADMEHLNHKGAVSFSVFFNRLLQDGLMQQENKQSFIDDAIKSHIQQAGIAWPVINNYK